MSDPPKKDANDVLRAGGEVELVGTPIDPRTVVSMDEYRARRAAPAAPEAPSGPPSVDTPMPGDGDGPGGGDPGERPKIVVNTEEGVVNRAAVAALARVPNIYVRGNALMRVLRGQQGRSLDPDAPTIDLIPKEVLQEHLAEAARFVALRPSKQGGWDEVPQHPPRWCVGNVHLRGAWPGLPVLHGVVETPVLRRDGTVLGAQGYDAESGLLLLSKSEPLVPAEMPTADDVRAALELLADVVTDVVWAHPAHRSTWLASVLTPLARAAFDGPSPLFLFEAPTAGTGKGLLVSCAVRIGTGRAPALDTYSTDDDEMRKQVVAWASGGRNVVVLDEVTGRLDGATLRSALTGDLIAGRLLGLSKTWSGPNLITWFATGNNVQKGKEMFRRIAPVQILSPVEDPSRRQNFKYPDLKSHVAKHQRELSRAALTILRGFCAAGRPDQKLSSWGSFESWSSLVRASIVWAGWPDPAEATLALREEDTRQAGYRSLASQWVRLVGLMNRGPVSTRDAIKYVVADPSPLPELRAVLEEVAADKDGKPSAKVLGYVLRALKHAVFATPDRGVVRFESKVDRNGIALWTAVVVSAGNGGDAGDPSAPTQQAISNSVGGDLSPASPPFPAPLLSQGEEKKEKTEEEDFWGWDD